MADLGTREVSFAYPGGPLVVENLTVDIPVGRITSIIGPNGCGKSTLLRGLARLLAPQAGTVILDGQSIQSQKTKDVAKQIGLLPQGPVVPDGILVEDLVARGRYPHQSLFQQWSQEDADAVEYALIESGCVELRGRQVDELSGGQRQRVWIALALAQQTPILLLDEPTTFLDAAHQLNVLNLLTRLNQLDGRTIVLVLHDINQAARFSHHMIAMNAGRIQAMGAPQRVVTESTVAAIFQISSLIMTDPVSGAPMCIPRAELTSEPALEMWTNANFNYTASIT
jgi:iron complex transport system ATP-binding protein